MKKAISLMRNTGESLGNRLNPVEVWYNVNTKAQSEHTGLWDLIEKLILRSHGREQAEITY